jgi:hypothetical protein
LHSPEEPSRIGSRHVDAGRRYVEVVPAGPVLALDGQVESSFGAAIRNREGESRRCAKRLGKVLRDGERLTGCHNFGVRNKLEATCANGLGRGGGYDGGRHGNSILSWRASGKCEKEEQGKCAHVLFPRFCQESLLIGKHSAREGDTRTSASTLNSSQLALRWATIGERLTRLGRSPGPTGYLCSIRRVSRSASDFPPSPLVHRSAVEC